LFNIELSLIGLLIGTLVGLTGVGGGVLMTPILIIVMGIPPSVAIGTDLFYAAITKIVGAAQHWNLKTVDVGIAASLATGSIPAVLIGTWLVKIIKESGGDAAENILSQILAAALIVVALVMLSRMVIGRLSTKPHNETPISRSRQKLFTVVLGFASGLLVGLTSIGAGSLIMLFLVMLYALPAKQLVGTDLFHAAILASIAALGHLLVGNVNLQVAGMLLVGSIPGVLIGSRISARVPESVLRFGIAVMLIVSGIRLIGV
jgi:uncharacterized membrane protein YfcA